MIMKKMLITISFFMFLSIYNVRAQSQEIQQLILNIEKLTQFKQILKDMKKGYEILNGGYNAVKDISEGNFTLHKTFLDALMQVSPTVRKYKKIEQIINYQILLVKESKKAYSRFAGAKNFSQKELDYFEKVYGNLLKQSLRNLDELTLVITADKLRMSDDERLSAIDKIYIQMEDKVRFLRAFNTSSNILALQRLKESNDVKTSKEMHNLKN